MRWTPPGFEEINLSGEVTAYVNTDDEARPRPPALASTEPVVASDAAQPAAT